MQALQAHLQALRSCLGFARMDDTSQADNESQAVPMAQVDLTEARQALADLMHAPGHDDGSRAPLFIRFSWHNSGTFDAAKGDGGSNGCTMRFAGGAEAADPENAGLELPRELLEPIKAKFSWMSYSDLYVLAGTVAIEQSGGPHIPFKTGRRDLSEPEAEARFAPSTGSGCPFGDGAHNPHKSRLPAADLGPDESAPAGASMAVKEAPTIAAVRGTFARMGFDDKETVALLILGHQYGRCHAEVSGFENAWYGFDPAHWNTYEHGMGWLSIFATPQHMAQYKPRTTAAGKRQFEMFFAGRRWMMLISDMALHWDPEYRKHVVFYHRNRKVFAQDAVAAWTKLIELGCDGLVPEVPQEPSTYGYDRYY